MPTLQKGTANVALKKEEALWHEHLGHSCAEHINELSRKDAVFGLNLNNPMTDSGGCESFLKGKQHKKSLHPNNSIPNGLVRFSTVTLPDQCRPDRSGVLFTSYLLLTSIRGTLWSSLSPKRATFRNVSRYFIYCLRESTNVLSSASTQMAEANTRHCMDILEENGTERNNHPAYCLELNGMAERTNRTITEAACSMLYHAKNAESLLG